MAGVGQAIKQAIEQDFELAQVLNITCEQPLSNNDERWEEPIPLYDHKPEPFPYDIFPKWLRSYVEAEAEATQTPVDLAGMLALSVLATTAAKKFIVSVRPGWIEPVNIWTVTVLPPGNRKSGVFSDMIRPIEEFEREERDRMAPIITEAQSKKRVLELSLQKAERDAAGAKEENKSEKMREATDRAKELSEIVIPPFLQLIADDASPESISSLMAAQGGKISLLSPEGDVFDIMAGRYSDKANLGNYLKGHAGDTIRVNRIGRAPEFINHPALTIGLTVQPEILRGLAGKPGFRGRGLLARFLYSVPNSLLGYRKVNPEPVEFFVEVDYKHNLTKILEIPSNIDEDGNPTPYILKFSTAAQSELMDFSQWLEPQLAPGGSLADMADWAGKAAGAVARISGLLHLAECVNDHAPWEHAVEATTVKAAIKLVQEYLIPHAKIAFADMGADPDIEAAKYVLDWFERTGMESFTKRDAHYSMQGKFKKVAELEPALKILIEYGYLREEEPNKQGPGRKPSPIYKVNPLTILT
jgi:replicative DNA helicase